MPRPRTGNLQNRGTSYRVRYTDTAGIRRHEVYKTKAEAELALRAHQISAGVRLPSQESEKRRRREGIYFIRSEAGLVKIGCSSNLDQRIPALISQSPSQLELVRSFETPNYLKLEKRLHEYFAEQRKHGEWFRISISDIDKAVLECLSPINLLAVLPSSILLGVGL